MHYYLYPKGGNSQYCAWILEFVKKAVYCEDVIAIDRMGRGGDSYSFLDDCKQEKSLEFNSIKIRQEISEGKACLYLTSKKLEDDLLENIIRNGIDKCFDGVMVLSALLNQYCSERFKNQKIIAIVLKNHNIEQKSLGFMIDLLQQKGFKIVYIITYQNFIHKEIETFLREKQQDYIYANFEILEQLSFFPFVIDQSPSMKFHQNVASLKMIPSMDMYPSSVTHADVQKSYDLFLHYSSYINIHSKTLYDLISKKQRFGGAFGDISHRLVKGGYPSLDKQIKSLETQAITHSIQKMDSIIVIGDTLCVKFYDILLRIIQNFLSCGIRVLYKPTNRYHEISLLNLKKTFEKENGFVWYDKQYLEQEELDRSFMAIESGISSMAYSYPILAKKPCILLYLGINSCDLFSIEDTFYHPSLHIRLCNDELKLLDGIARQLKADENYQKYWRDKIEHYCKEDMYHYGNASEYLVEWINQWYRKREILKRQN